MHPPLSILAVTNIYPSAARPTLGVFVEQQIKGLREIGLKVNVFYVNRAGEGMGAYFRMMRPLAAAVEEHKPSLLHVMYGGVMADRVTAWNSELPKVVTFHGSDLLGENFSGYHRKLISQVGTFCSRRAARRAHGVIVVSSKLRSALPAGLDAAKVRVIPCGIDLERFRPLNKAVCQRQLGWDANSFNVLFASNNGDPVKRPGLAAAAVEAVNATGVKAELRMMRGVSNADVPTWMNASDALVLTSVHEGSPTVVKEALACGLPVVSVDVGDVAERIRGIDACHLASPEPADLAKKLLLVRRAGARVQAVRQVQDLSLNSIASQLDKFYRETLAVAQPAGLHSSRAVPLSAPC